MDRPFYEKGLAFECQPECSKCCGGSPGYVFISDEEIAAMALAIGVEREHFLIHYTKMVDDRISLLDLEDDNWNCVMLKEGKCTVYEHRPLQCRTFPFWPTNILSRKAWDEASKGCPGIGCGHRYSKDEIESIAVGEETVDSIK